MITYQADENGRPIDGNGNLVELPKTPWLYNGTHVIVFESNQEKQAYIDALPVAWSKENYARQLNEAHNALFHEYYTDRDYLGMEEIPLWLGDADFDEEAQNLIHWWKGTCKEVAAYLETVTEQTAVTIEDFINSLPAL